MKKFTRMVFLALFAFFVAGCGGGGVTIDLGGNTAVPSQPAYPLQAVIDAPVNGSNLALGPINIQYHATAQEGVAEVELSVNGEVVSRQTTPDSKQPLVTVKYTWQPSLGGTHVLRVRALSSKGVWSSYAESTINIQAPTQPQPTQPAEQPTPTQPSASASTSTPTAEGVQIVRVDKSTNIFFWGLNTCGPVKLTLNIQLNDAKDVFQVVVFNRLWSSEGEGSAGWDSGYAMKPLGEGEYTFTYTETNVRNPHGQDRSEFHYQFVVMGKNNVRLYKSEVYKDVIFNHCP